MNWYTLNDIAKMSGMTTRTLRNYLRLGILEGEKVDGVWRFSEEQLYAFMDNPSARQGMHAKQNAIVTDFLLMSGRKENRTCVILDICMEREEAEQVAAFFCERMKEQEDESLQFGMEWHKKNMRIILSGTETAVKEIMKRYYEEN